MDRAVWRRFQLRLMFPAPDERQLEAFVPLYVKLATTSGRAVQIPYQSTWHN